MARCGLGGQNPDTSLCRPIWDVPIQQRTDANVNLVVEVV